MSQTPPPTAEKPCTKTSQPLSSTLIDQLAGGARRKVVSALRGRAQVAIDILVRNLFERTADIGFLATDAELRRFAECAGADRERLGPALLDRLRAYQRSHTVYDDIVVLEPAGAVLARLEKTADAASCSGGAGPSRIAPAEGGSTTDAFFDTALRGTAPGVEAPVASHSGRRASVRSSTRSA